MKPLQEIIEKWWPKAITTTQYATPLLNLLPPASSVLDERFVIDSLYTPPAPILVQCPNCGYWLDWISSQYDCNWCCRTWDYDGIKNLVKNGGTFFQTKTENGTTVHLHACFDVAVGLEAHQVDNLLCDLIDIFWCYHFLTQDGKKVLSKRDYAFCVFVYLAMEEYLRKPHQHLINRLRKIKTQLRTLLPLVMYTSTDKLFTDLQKSKNWSHFKPRKKLDHNWWTSKPYRPLGNIKQMQPVV